MSKKIVLVDGHSILNRAFYGVPDLTNSKGFHTNAIYGFLNIMFKILEEEKADYLTVAFDLKDPTFRHEIYKEYKGTRKPMPEELREQVPVMKEVLKAMGVFIVEKSGLEADDILGTIAKHMEAEGMQVSLVSGDRDLLQIASDNIKIRIPKTKGGKTEVIDYYASDVEREYGMSPTQFIDLKALMGDTADNIPGVPKVGEKTATELMCQYGSIEGIYEHIEDITKKSIKESLIQNKHLAELSKVLATIEVNGEFDFSITDAEIGNFYNKEAYAYFKDLEFKNFLNRFEDKNDDKEISGKFALVSTEEDLSQSLQACDKATTLGMQFFVEDNFFGVALSAEGEGTCLVVEGEKLSREKILFELEKTIKEKKKSNQGRRFVATYDVKKLYPFFEEEDRDVFFDTDIAAYLINPLKNDYEPQEIASEHVGISFPGRAELFGKMGLEDSFLKKQEEFLSYTCYCAYSACEAMPVLEQVLTEQEMITLFNEMEMPLSYVLYDMEKEGIEVRKEELHAYGEALLTRIHELEHLIYKGAGEEFNINSPKQLGEILFEKMGIPGGKKTKTGYSTAAEVLEKLAAEYPFVADILEYRGLAKLKSTYADGLANYIDENNRIHTNFRQTIAATGRISSTEPNLQNIPMRMELGRKIRKVFVPKEGYVFLDADYSQIELRLLAHMSGDEELINAYQIGNDIHRITASKVFHTPFEEVTDLQRRNAKAVNFGIVYGISSFGLSQDLSITRKEAAKYIDQYFETYPGVKKFLDNLVVEAKETGVVTTIFGRRRPIPELKSTNFMQRSFGERIAMNSPLQGTAADIIKLAMIHVWDRLKEENLKSKLILQVHDELLIETAPDEVEEVKKLLREEMMHAAELRVSLEVDLHMGKNWYESK